MAGESDDPTAPTPEDPATGSTNSLSDDLVSDPASDPADDSAQANSDVPEDGASEPGTAAVPGDVPALTTTAVRAAPVKSLPAALDAVPGYQPTFSCDPNDKPGILMFAELVSEHWGRSRYHTSRACVLGDGTQHAEGRALDWTLNAYNAQDKAIGDAVVLWLTANNGAIARRFGIMYLIWNRQIWYTHRPTTFETYGGSNPHTDHIHFSFTWDGAMGRTSWWTGQAVTQSDQGTCRVYAGQYAPRYTQARTTPCPTSLPAAPWSAYPVTLPGTTSSAVSLAQVALGFTGGSVDGSFGPMTLAALLSYQAEHGLPVTGVLDNATWAEMATALPQVPFEQVVAAPDATGDGYSDAVVVDQTGRLFIFPGVGAGRFGAVRPFGRGWSRMAVYAPGDWNGDGLGDLVAVDPEGQLWLYAATRSGRLSAAAKIGRGWTGYRITAAGDVNGDRKADLLAIDGDHRLWLYPGNGSGGFAARIQVGNGWSGFDLYAAGDMNRDGRTDVLSIDSGGRLWFYAGRGGGYFLRRVAVGHGWNGFTLASGGDFNRDGISDLLGRAPDGVLWFYAGRAAGGFAHRVQVPGAW